LSSVITAYNADEIAVIASGPFEISACANIPTAVNYVVQSLDEAIARFNPDAKKVQEMEKAKAKEEPKPEPKPEPKVEEPKKEEPKPEVKEEPKLKPETIKKEKAKKEQPAEKPEEEKKAE
jgi:hypothetical protein